MLEYLRAYAERFGLYETIQFQATVQQLQPHERGWCVRLASGEERLYRGVVIANGHNWDPRLPNYRGKFSGSTLHSSEYKTPDVLQGKRVLVVGGGNSAGQGSVFLSEYARNVYHLVRRNGLQETMSEYLIRRITDN